MERERDRERETETEAEAETDRQTEMQPTVNPYVGETTIHLCQEGKRSRATSNWVRVQVGRNCCDRKLSYASQSSSFILG